MGSSLIAQVKRASRAEGLAEGLAEGRAEGLAEGLAQGRTKGEIEAARSLCSELARQHHGRAFPLVAGAIEACADLREWALAAPLISDDEFVRLVTAPRPVRSRAPRPSRQSPSRRR